MELRKINALLRFYFSINPNELTDEQWCIEWNNLKFALDFDNNKYNGK